MFIPFSLVKKYLEIDDLEILVNSLNSLGFQVENVCRVGNELINVRIGKIISKEAHPNADKLSICKVSFNNDILQIITADSTVNVGDIVLVALDGCVLPSSLVIQKRLFRGVESYGMMLSTQELKWDNIKAYGEGVSKFNFDKKISSNVGKYISEVINLTDWVIEIQPIANKVESLGLYHIFKELSFLLKVPLKKYNLFEENIEKVGYPIRLETSDCKFYLGVLLKDVKIDLSPVELQLILTWMNVKPINNVVDLTNFVMYELAQPMHVFDYDLIRNGIIVRKSENGEQIKALDGNDYLLTDNDLIISDYDRNVLALAGIIGSRIYSINENTKNILLEVANFSPYVIRKTSKRLNLYTNSSKRFEKNVPVIYTQLAYKRYLYLLNELNVDVFINGYNFSGDIGNSKVVQFGLDRLRKFIGFDFKEEEIKKIAEVFSDEVLIDNGSVSIKTYRNDINYWWDVAEELCRFIGYKNLVDKALSNFTSEEKIYYHIPEKNYQFLSDIRKRFVFRGYFEVIGYNLLNPEYLKYFGDQFIKINNYMSIDNSAYRNSILPSILNIASDNYKSGYKFLKIFEIGKIFDSKERYQLGFLILNDNKSFLFDKKNFILNELQNLKDIFKSFGLFIKEYDKQFSFLNHSYGFFYNGEIIGVIGILNHKLLDYFSYPPLTLVGYVDLEYLINRKENNKEFVAYSELNPVYKDISFVFYKDRFFDYDYFYGILNNELSEKFENFQCYLLDIYDFQDDKLSYTFRLELKPKVEITNEDINFIFEKVFDKLSSIGILRRT